MTETAAQQLAALRLQQATGQQLADFVTFRRGHHYSWRRIANELEAAAGHPVSGETLRTWFAEKEPAR